MNIPIDVFRLVILTAVIAGVLFGACTLPVFAELFFGDSR